MKDSAFRNQPKCDVHYEAADFDFDRITDL
jgi:hypothetical protein